METVILAAVCTVCCAFLYQLVALPLYTFDGIGPDFVLAAVCALSVYGRPTVALLVAFSCGVIFGFLSLDPWTARALGYLAAAWILVRGRRRARGVVSGVVLVSAASLVAAVVRHSILFLHYGEGGLSPWSIGFVGALYSSVISCLIVAVLSPFKEVLAGPRRRSEFHQTVTAP